MNPSGDHGKRELSPALRNRFTEIWCKSILDGDNFNKRESEVIDFFHSFMGKSYEKEKIMKIYQFFKFFNNELENFVNPLNMRTLQNLLSINSVLNNEFNLS